MSFKNIFTKQAFLFLTAFSLLSIGCGSGKNKSKDSDDLQDTDTAKTALLNVGGEIISIPSPIQTAFLINKTGASFDKAMLNPTTRLTTYTTKFLKALNLGVYGADLGYVTMYDQTQDALGYMNSVRKIGDDLGVSSAFNPQLMQRFQNNFGKKDSMLSLVTIAYRQSDSYLKNNKQNDLSGLILTGGWVETMHFVTNVLKTKDNDEIKRRIAEQKSTVQSILKLLTPYASDKQYAELIAKFNELSSAFEGIELKYTYQKPIVDEEKKTTTITSNSEVKITAEQIKNITEKIFAIRTLISGSAS
jgi:hypothetical protein